MEKFKALRLSSFGTATNGRASEHADVLMPLSYGYIGEDDGGSLFRIIAATLLITNSKVPEKCIIPFPQGYPPEKSAGKDINSGAQSREESLGKNLARFARQCAAFSKAEILQEEHGWSTRVDIFAAYKMVARKGYRTAHFYFVTDAAHMKRVKMIWCLTHPKDWTATFHVAKSHVRSRKERFGYEPISYLKNLALLLPRWFLSLFIGRPTARHLTLADA